MPVQVVANDTLHQEIIVLGTDVIGLFEAFRIYNTRDLFTGNTWNIVELPLLDLDDEVQYVKYLITAAGTRAHDDVRYNAYIPGLYEGGYRAMIDIDPRNGGYGVKTTTLSIRFGLMEGRLELIDGAIRFSISYAQATRIDLEIFDQLVEEFVEQLTRNAEIIRERQSHS